MKTKKKRTFGKMIIFAVMLTVLAGCVHTVMYTKKWEKAHPPTGEFKTIDGQQIHYLDLNNAANSELSRFCSFMVPVLIFLI